MEWFEGYKLSINGVEYLSGFPAFVAYCSFLWLFFRSVLDTVGDIARLIAKWR